MTDPELEPTADALRRALSGRADEVEPSHDAYARLATRVVAASSGPGARPGAAARWGRSRLAGAVAATMVLTGAVGAGLTMIGDGDQGRGQAVVGGSGADSSASTVSPSPGITEPGAPPPTVVDATEVPPVPSDIGPAPATPSMTAAVDLAGPSRAATVDSFLHRLGVTGPDVGVEYEIDGDRVSVWALTEGTSDRGPLIATLTLSPVPEAGDDHWVVTGATSDQVTIDQPGPPIGERLDATELVVSGMGSGFEGDLDVELRSAVDGTILARQGAQGGALGPAPYETTLDLVGTDRAWLVVRSGGGADGVAAAFAAIPLAFVGGPDYRPYSVVRIGPDDPDQGLVVRAGPGTGNPELDVVPAAGVVTRRSGAYPTLNGSTVWWPVTSPGGAEGWVAAWYLAGTSEPGDGPDAHLAAGERFLAELARVASGGPWTVVVDRPGFSLWTGGASVVVDPAEMGAPGAWLAEQAELGGRSVVEVFDLPPDLEGVELVWGADTVTVDRHLVDGYFGGVPAVTATWVGLDGQARRAVVFWSVRPDGGLAPIGALVEPVG